MRIASMPEPPHLDAPAPAPVRRLTAADAAAYNRFLREGVRAHPDTLRISEADIDAAPFATDESPDTVTFAVIDPDGTWVGVASVERERGRTKRRHIAWVVRMYVSGARAGAGVGRTLLRAAIAHAAAMPGVFKLNLTVAAHNERAIALYASEGFQTFAREEDAFRDPSSRTELTLSRPL